MSITECAAGQPPDAVLLHRVSLGDLDALQTIFSRYRNQVYNLSYGITRDSETSEEVLQDVFYRLYTHAGRLDTSLPLLPWLYRVTANLSYNSTRRRWNWMEPLTTLTERLFSPSRRSPEFVAEQRELQMIVRETLEGLSANHRAVITLFYLNEFSIPEIAEILELPEGTIKSRLHHGRKMLKERLIRRLGETNSVLDYI